MKYFCKMFVSEKYLFVYVIDFQHVTQNNRGRRGSLAVVFVWCKHPFFEKRKKIKKSEKILKKGKKLLSLHYLKLSIKIFLSWYAVVVKQWHIFMFSVFRRFKAQK